MSDILRQWLNDELQLSRPVQSFERDLANGYLVGEILNKLGYLKNNVFHATFKDNKHPLTLVSNWGTIASTLDHINIRLSPHEASEVKEARAGAALRLVYQLKMAHAKLNQTANMKTAIGLSDMGTTSKFPQKLVKPRAVHGAKQIYGQVDQDNRTRQIVDGFYENSKEKHMSAYLQKFTNHMIEREKVVTEMEMQDKTAREMHQNLFRHDHLETMRESARFKADWTEDGYGQWATNMDITSARKARERRFDQKQSDTKQNRAHAALENSRQEFNGGLEQFEQNLQAIQTCNAPSFGSPLSNTLSKPTHRLHTPLRPMSAEKRKLVRTQTNDPQRPATDGPGRHLEELQSSLPTNQEQFEIAREQAQIILNQKEETSVRRQDRSRRRRVKVAWVLDSHAEQEVVFAEEYFESLGSRVCHEGKRIDNDLFRLEQYNDIIRENRKFYEQQLQETAAQQTLTQLERDRNMHNSAIMLYENEIALQQRRFEEIRAQERALRHEDANQYCGELVSRVLDMVYKVVCFKDLQDSEWVTAAVWSEWMSTFVQDFPLVHSTAEVMEKANAEAAGAPAAAEASVAAVAPVAAAAAAQPPDSGKTTPLPTAGSAAAGGEPSRPVESIDVKELSALVMAEMDVVSDLSEKHSAMLDDLAFEKYLKAPKPPAPNIPPSGTTSPSPDADVDAGAGADAEVAGDEATATFEGGKLGEVVQQVISIACGKPTPLPKVKRDAIGICLLGKPFSGKRTQANNLAEAFNLKCLSMDDLVAAAVAGKLNLPVAAEIKAKLERGEVLTDDMYVRLAVSAIGDMATPLPYADDEKPKVADKDKSLSGGEKSEQNKGSKDESKSEGVKCAGVKGEGEENSRASVAKPVKEQQLSTRSSTTRTSVARKKVAPAAAPAPVVVQAPVKENFSGWILINFPETKAQAAMLEKALSGFQVPVPNPPGPPKIVNNPRARVSSRIAPPPPTPPRTDPYPSGIDLVVRFEADNEVAARRALGRREDPVTKAQFHVEFQQPDDDSPNKERLVRLVDQLHIEAKLPESFCAFEDQENDLNMWFNEFATIRLVPGDKSREDIDFTLKGLVKQVLDGRKKEATAEVETAKAKAKEAEQQKAAEAGRRADIAAAVPESKDADADEDPPAAATPSPAPTDEDYSVTSFCDTDLAKILANSWILLEKEYTDGMRNLFRKLRTARCADLDHFALLRKNFLRFLQRADSKMKVLEPFQEDFNKMQPDLRKDMGAKEELHQRTDELNEQLTAIVDERKQIAHDQFAQINADGWLENSVGVFSFLYLSMMQLEIDRYQGAIGLVQDYFAVTMKQVVADIELPPVVNLPINMLDQTGGRKTAGGGKAGAAKGAVKAPAKVDKKKGKDAGKTPSSDSKPEVAVMEVPLEPLQNAMQAALEKVIMPKSDDTDDDKKNAKGGGKPGAKKGKDKGGEVAEAAPEPGMDQIRAILHSIFQAEGDLLKSRLESIFEAAKRELSELIDKIQAKLYQKMRNWMTDRIQAEYDAIASLIFLVKTAIEEEKPLYFRLRLEDENFYVDPLVVKALPQLPPSGPFDDVFRQDFQQVPTPMQVASLARHFHSHASGDTVTSAELCEATARLSNTQSRCTPNNGLPMAWRGMDQAVWRKVISLFDPLDSGLVDWREFVVALLLPSSVSSPSIAQLEQMAKMLVAADSDKDGKLTWSQFSELELWFEKELPAAWQLPTSTDTGSVLSLPEEKEPSGIATPIPPADEGEAEAEAQQAQPSPQPAPPLTKVMVLKQLLFRLFSTKHPQTNAPRPSTVMEEGDSARPKTSNHQPLPSIDESFDLTDSLNSCKAFTPSLHDETVGMNGLLGIHHTLLYMAFDDEAMPGAEKGKKLGASLMAEKTKAAAEKTEAVITRFWLRVESTHRSKFSRKHLVEFIDGLR